MIRRSWLRLAVPLLAAALLAGACADPAPSAPATTGAPAAIDRAPGAPDPTPGQAAAPAAGPAPAPPAPTAPPGPDRAAAVLAGMSVDDKIGQLLMPVLAGRAPDQVTPEERKVNVTATGRGTPAEIVQAYHLGGVIYLAPNVTSADQVVQLTAGLQSVARAGTGFGLLVAVDQEGGRVNRITDEMTVFPAAAVLSGDTAAVREAGYLTGRQVSGLGVNVVLAPVADVTRPDLHSFINNRSYGDDPAVVATMVEASVDGLHDAGVAAAVKHFPGHGGTGTDSHLELPVLGDVTRASWDARERIPFQAAISHRVDIVLTGHLALPALDPAGVPATVSPVLIDGLLRHDLGFDGVVMTDALNMGAVAGIDPGRLVVEAILAGGDILLEPPDLAGATRALRAAVASGEISRDRLDTSVLRILRLKDRLGLLPAP